MKNTTISIYNMFNKNLISYLRTEVFINYRHDSRHHPGQNLLVRIGRRNRVDYSKVSYHVRRGIRLTESYYISHTSSMVYANLSQGWSLVQQSKLVLSSVDNLAFFCFISTIC